MASRTRSWHPVTDHLTGNIIETGTPGGVGHKRDRQIYMKPGDVVEVEITGLGILRNDIM